VGIGLVVVAATSYGYLVVSARVLGKAEYGPLSVLWALVFLVGPGFFLPMEQELGRALAARRTAGEGGGPLIRRAALLGATLLGALLLAGVATHRLLLDHLLGGRGVLLLAWAVSLVGAYAGYLFRGVTSGLGRFGAYSRFLASESAIRFAGCLALAAIGAETAGPYGLVLGLAPLAAVAAVACRERGLAEPGPPALTSEVSTALGALLLGSVASMALVNAGPLAMQLLASDRQKDEVGRFLAGLIIARVPLFLFQAVQAALLPQLAVFAEQGQRDELVAALRRLEALLSAVVAVAVIAGFAVGPSLLGIVFGSEFDLSGRTLGLLALGSGAYLLALPLAQATIALAGHLAMAWGWVVGVAGLVATLIVDRGDLFLRVELSIVAGGVASLVAQAAILRARLGRGAEIVPGGMLEALVDSPLEP
jgi:O-antigen/teichoic acid export membrane protein